MLTTARNAVALAVLTLVLPAPARSQSEGVGFGGLVTIDALGDLPRIEFCKESTAIAWAFGAEVKIHDDEAPRWLDYAEAELLKLRSVLPIEMTCSNDPHSAHLTIQVPVRSGSTVLFLMQIQRDVYFEETGGKPHKMPVWEFARVFHSPPDDFQAALRMSVSHAVKCLLRDYARHAPQAAAPRP